MLSRRTFILGSGAVALAPLAKPLLSSEYLTSRHLAGPRSLDLIQQKYPFASTAVLKLACWDEFLENEPPAPATCQFVKISSNWKVV